MIWALNLHEFRLLEARLSNPSQIDASSVDPFTPAYSPAGTVKIHGVLVPTVDRLMHALGVHQTSYAAIVQGIRAADGSESVSRITLDIDSPGGSVNGLSSVLSAIAECAKPVDVIARNANSAAYAIAASATGQLLAADEWSSFGSVGVVMSKRVDSRDVTITSTDAPNKRPDLSTDAGKDAVRGELDEYHNLLVSAIAKGRGVTAEKVNQDFCRGGSCLASQALSRGMIDGIRRPGGSVSDEKAHAMIQSTLNARKAEAEPPADLQEEIMRLLEGGDRSFVRDVEPARKRAAAPSPDPNDEYSFVRP